MKNTLNNIQIKKVLDDGNFVENDLYRIYFKNKCSCFKLALMVKKKFFKLAVDRNKIKRQIREMLKELQISKNIGVVIIVNNKYDPEKYIYNSEKMKQLINKIN